MDGSNFTTEEIEGLKFTIDGNEVTAIAGSSVNWRYQNDSVLVWDREDNPGNIITLKAETNYPDGYNVTEVE